MRRTAKPARFMLITFIGALLLGVGFNLYLTYRTVTWLRAYGGMSETFWGEPERESWPPLMSAVDVPSGSIGHWDTIWIGNYEFFTLKYDAFEEKPEFTFESGVERSFTIHSFGYPFHTRSTYLSSQDPYGQSTAVKFHKPSRDHYHATGFILNPIVYALPVWLVVVGIYLAVRTRLRSTRRRKGLCEHCAYDTQGLAKCPECGAETPSAATIQA